MKTGERFALVLDALDTVDVPTAVRLRAALKRLLRSYGLKCIDIRQVPADEPLSTTVAVPGPGFASGASQDSKGPLELPARPERS